MMHARVVKCHLCRSRSGRGWQICESTKKYYPESAWVWQKSFRSIDEFWTVFHLTAIHALTYKWREKNKKKIIRKKADVTHEWRRACSKHYCWFFFRQNMFFAISLHNVCVHVSVRRQSARPWTTTATTRRRQIHRLTGMCFHAVRTQNNTRLSARQSSISKSNGRREGIITLQHT